MLTCYGFKNKTQKKKKILYAIVYLARFVTCFKAYSKTSQVKTINRVDSYSMFHSSAASKTWPTKTAQDEQCESLTDKPRHPPLFSFLEAPVLLSVRPHAEGAWGRGLTPGHGARVSCAWRGSPSLSPPNAFSCGWGGLTFAAWGWLLPGWGRRCSSPEWRRSLATPSAVKDPILWSKSKEKRSTPHQVRRTYDIAVHRYI